MDAGKLQLDEASEKLTKSQIEGILQLSEATAQLADAKNQLAQGQSQLDAAKDSAKESADLNQILTVDMLGNLLAAPEFFHAGRLCRGRREPLHGACGR